MEGSVHDLILRYHHRIYPEGLRKTTKDLTQVSSFLLLLTMLLVPEANTASNIRMINKW
jgi:hypothetical protein